MAKQVPSVKATARTGAGTGPARAVRREGRIPAIIYGGKEAPIMIALEERTFTPFIRQPGFFNHLMDIEADGKTIRVLPRDVQYEPVSDRPEHVDFMRVQKDMRIRVDVPVVFINQDKSPGLKRGGTINIVQHELRLLCAPDNIPEKIEINVDGLNIGDAIHINKIKLPDGVTPIVTSRADTTIASIAAPTTIKEETVATAATTAEGAAPAEGAAAAPGAAPAAGAAAPAAGGKAAAPAKGAGAAAEKPAKK
jgi:large subunit ribosomal protein L25